MTCHKAVLIDIGSTFTKVTLVDLNAECILGVAQAPTTVQTDVCKGLQLAFGELGLSVENASRADYKVACSSAAGGLKMVIVGLVPSLTLEAGKRAALGAGAKVVGSYSYELTDLEIMEIESLKPDLVLLAGGTNGGNTEVPIHNASKLSSLDPSISFIIACNKVASPTAEKILTNCGRAVRRIGNVMPALGVLVVSEARKVIRELFLEHIVEAKGMSTVERLIEGVIMPTPVSVLYAAELLSKGTKGEAGLGELVIVDVGGATTDIHSVAKGDPTSAEIIQKGLPEPLAKRTVEGDLGVRINAQSILDVVGRQDLLENIGCESVDIETKVAQLSQRTMLLPANDVDEMIDAGLARSAVQKAMERHAGYVELRYTPFGETHIQFGKDLTSIGILIGTGGVFAQNRYHRHILEGALFRPSEPHSLRPKNPEIYVDSMYVFAAMGLLAEKWPDKALRIMKKSLKQA